MLESVQQRHLDAQRCLSLSLAHCIEHVQPSLGLLAIKHTELLSFTAGLRVTMVLGAL